MRRLLPTPQELAALFALWCLCALAGATQGANRVVCWKLLASRPCVPFVVGDTEAGLPSAPQGVTAYAIDTGELLCRGAGSWAPCATGSGPGSGAPDDAQYVVGATDGDLSAERVGTSTSEIAWDFGTGGQAKLNLVDDSIAVARFKTSDTPADGECFVYESTGDEVAWQTCGGSGGLPDDDYGLFTAASGVATVNANSIPLGTATTGNYAGSSSEGGAATTADDVVCTNCLGGAEIDESALGTVPTATSAGTATSSSDLSCTNCIGGPEVDESTLVLAATRLPSIDNPPASAHAYSCEFDGSDCSWTWGTGGSATTANTGSVSPVTNQTDPVKDLTSWPGWLLVQSDENGGGDDFVSLTLNVTLDTNATVCFRPLGAQATGNNVATYDSGEASVRLTLWNSSDSNETVYWRFDRDATAVYEVEYGVQNNGSFTSADISIQTSAAAVIGVTPVACVWKTSNSYLFGLVDDGAFYNGGAIAKSGVTTLDRMSLYFFTADETPSAIMGVDWLRYYATNTFALVNP